MGKFYFICSGDLFVIDRRERNVLIISHRSIANCGRFLILRMSRIREAERICKKTHKSHREKGSFLTVKSYRKRKMAKNILCKN